MSEAFNPREIIEIAVEVEENGRKIYEALENKATDEKLKSMWRYLKEQEINHKNLFQKVLDNIKEYIAEEFSPGEYKAYLDAVASNYVFDRKLTEEKINKLFKDDVEAIDFGIYIEKESISTYTALKDYISLDKQSVLEKIIYEEKKHFATLVEMKKALLKKET